MVQIQPFSGNSPWEGEAPAELAFPVRQEPPSPRDCYPDWNHAGISREPAPTSRVQNSSQNGNSSSCPHDENRLSRPSGLTRSCIPALLDTKFAAWPGQSLLLPSPRRESRSWFLVETALPWVCSPRSANTMSWAAVSHDLPGIASIEIVRVGDPYPRGRIGDEAHVGDGPAAGTLDSLLVSRFGFVQAQALRHPIAGPDRELELVPDRRVTLPRRRRVEAGKLRQHRPRQ